MSLIFYLSSSPSDELGPDILIINLINNQVILSFLASLRYCTFPLSEGGSCLRRQETFYLF
jgi:hypothetical protein